MTIKIEFPTGDALAAHLLGVALQEYAAGTSGINFGGERGDPEIETTAAGTLDSDVDDFLNNMGESPQTEGGDEPPPAPADLRVDQNGVPFDMRYCAESKEPFYASGKTAGQWKKKRGVEQSLYDGWYAEQLALVGPAGDGVTDDADAVNTAAAFGVGDAPAPAVKTAGELMAWCAEMQAANALTTAQVGEAYTATGLTIASLFPPSTPEQVEENVARVHTALVAMVGGQ